jgi:translation initiation factor IF-3
LITIANNKNELPINDNIRVAEMMVIGPNGEQMGIKNITDALTLANYAGLDLVLMNGNSTPAVAKIMDYNKYKYERNKKLKEAQKNQRAANKDVKEYRLSVNIDVHDFDTRVKQASKYLEKGHRIKASIRFRGREMAHTELGKDVLVRFADALTEYSSIDQKPTLDGRNMTMILIPKKDK